VPARILIADDHDVVRQGICSIIAKSRPEWEFCGEATNGRDAVEAARMLSPDVIILDITMPLLKRIEAASEIATFGLLVFGAGFSYSRCAKSAATAMSRSRRPVVILFARLTRFWREALFSALS